MDFIAQVHEATNSPSTITRLLQDPTILPQGSAEDLNKERKHRSRSHSRHRSPLIAAIAIAEEEKRAQQLKVLLRGSSERLEYEMQRAEEATARAAFAELQEREAFARAKTAQDAKFEMEMEATRVERELRSHQIELEGSHREIARLEEEIQDMKREMEALQKAENRAQRSLREFQLGWKKMEIETREYAIEVQGIVDKSYKDGKEDGYNEGYEDGYRAGVKEGVRKGRKEGLREGREQGRIEERRNALEAFDRFLSEDTNDAQRVCVILSLCDLCSTCCRVHGSDGGHNLFIGLMVIQRRWGHRTRGP